MWIRENYLKGREREQLMLPTKLINYDQCCGENDIFSCDRTRVDPHITLLITFIDQHFILMNWED